MQRLASLNTGKRKKFSSRRGLMFTGAVGLLSAVAVDQASAEFPQIRLQSVSSGQLVGPVGLANAGDGSNRLFTIDQRGKIQILQNGSLLPTPFLDIESKLVPERAGFDERGLLGLAFHPNFSTSGATGEGKFYVFYSAPSPNAPGTVSDPVNAMTVVAEYSVTAPGSNVADPNSERILFTFDKPQFNHNSGQLAFGPDGMLYIGTGDGGGAADNDAGHTGGTPPPKPDGVLGNSQDRSNLLGKILRIDVNGNNGPTGQYGIPADNPFVGENGVREEIYAFGTRNPWKFSFDSGPGGTNRLFVADVGQGLVEEVNIVHSGDNLGWRIREGTRDFDPTAPNASGIPLTDPIAQYAHPGANIPGLQEIGLSITGGFVYRGTEFPQLTGKYIFADWSNQFDPGQGTLLGLEADGNGDWTLSVLDVLGGNPIDLYITAFGKDENHELYIVARGNLAASGLGPNGEHLGEIFKIVPVPEPASAVVFSLAAAGTMMNRRRPPRMTKHQGDQ